MKKFFITLSLILTTITVLFAEERKWNIEYCTRMVTPDEFYATVTMNPHWQEYDLWIDEDHDNLVDYMDPYWDNTEAKTTMKRILQEAESIKKEYDNDKIYAFIEISYGDSSVDSINTTRAFIKDLDTYEMWEFCF